MKRTLLLIMCAGLLLVGLAGCKGEEDKATPEAGKAELQEEGQAEAAPIKIGSMMDLSGPTSSVGRPYAKGIKACVGWLNGQGGIDGRPIKLYEVDTSYNAQQGLAAYKKLVTSKGIVANQGFGTAVTEALVRFAAKDEIPYFSASYSAHLTDPKKAPYNFFTAADYSTQLRAGLKYFRENWDKSRNPRLAFVYPDHPYGLVPIPAGKDFAKELGFDIVGEENVGLKAIDATSQLLSLKPKKPDFTWVGGTTPSTAVIMKDAKKLDMDTTFFVNIWGVDETIFQLAGDACNGDFSLQAAAVYGQDVPGMKVIKKLTDGEPQLTHYIRGFASMLVMAEGIRMAAKDGPLTGPAIKAALESMRDYDPMGLTPPISFYPDDHRPNMAVFLYKLQDGKMQFVGEEKLPRRAEWLGY
jgi:branched-chain amino acid transport system substrate-binding protein